MKYAIVFAVLVTAYADVSQLKVNANRQYLPPKKNVALPTTYRANIPKAILPPPRIAVPHSNLNTFTNDLPLSRQLFTPARSDAVDQQPQGSDQVVYASAPNSVFQTQINVQSQGSEFNVPSPEVAAAEPADPDHGRRLGGRVGNNANYNSYPTRSAGHYDRNGHQRDHYHERSETHDLRKHKNDHQRSDYRAREFEAKQPNYQGLNLIHGHIAADQAAHLPVPPGNFNGNTQGINIIDGHIGLSGRDGQSGQYNSRAYDQKHHTDHKQSISHDYHHKEPKSYERKNEYNHHHEHKEQRQYHDHNDKHEKHHEHHGNYQRTQHDHHGKDYDHYDHDKNKQRNQHHDHHESYERNQYDHHDHHDSYQRNQHDHQEKKYDHHDEKNQRSQYDHHDHHKNDQHHHNEKNQRSQYDHHDHHKNDQHDHHDNYQRNQHDHHDHHDNYQRNQHDHDSHHENHQQQKTDERYLKTIRQYNAPERSIVSSSAVKIIAFNNNNQPQFQPIPQSQVFTGESDFDSSASAPEVIYKPGDEIDFAETKLIDYADSRRPLENFNYPRKKGKQSHTRIHGDTDLRKDGYHYKKPSVSFDS